MLVGSGTALTTALGTGFAGNGVEAVACVFCSGVAVDAGLGIDATTGLTAV